MFLRVSTVMFFAPEPEKTARWWGQQLGVEVRLDIGEKAGKRSVYAWLNVAGIEMGWHQADDERNPPGGSQVPYFAVEHVDQVREELLAAGCTLHRGPMQATDDDPDRWICQVIDPFGAFVGLEGPL